MSKGKKIYCIISVLFSAVMLIMCLTFGCRQHAYASERDRVGSFRSADNEDDVPDNNAGLWLRWNNEEGNISAPIRMMLVLTVLALAPSIMVLLTSFTRIVVVLHFVRTALGTQTSPPNQVMVGLALFLTLLIMSPTFEQVTSNVLVPSFIISELRSAFIIGFLIYIPFIVIDMVVASVLMSMGMMMLPPTTISMPFKILLFVLADGWNLVIGKLVETFY